MEWIEKEVSIAEIDTLLKEGYHVEVDSPDGWVGVNFFIDKGEYEEYILTTENGLRVSCNENHLFETSYGWKKAGELPKNGRFFVLTDSGWESATIFFTGNKIPIVDINVDHPNHRYYTNGVSSHNTGVGKSLFLCHHAANCLVQNLNVLYITCEMAEERIAERIDANLLDITLDSLKELPKNIYDKKMEALKSKIHGKLIVKEYPTASASVANFKHLLDELKIKKRFIPDVIFVDYINICASARIKQNANTNSYFYIKSVAEELRGLAVEYNVPIFSATQVNRSGFANSDFGLEDTSESFGLPATADFFCALISTDDLENLGQILVKQLKNRYNSATVNKKFVVGIDRSKMKLFDVKRDDQDGISDSNQNNPHGYGNGYSPRQIPNLVKVNDWKIE